MFANSFIRVNISGAYVLLYNTINYYIGKMSKKIESIKDTLFETIFNHAHNGIAIVGLNGNWVKVNQSLLDMLGYTETEMYGMSFQDITHKDDLAMDMKNLHQLLEGRIKRYQIEKRYFHKKGKVVWVLLSVSLATVSDNNPLYFISQVLNITKRKEISWQMNAISDIVKKQNEKLMDFAHIATHDIRTHIGNLNTIAGFIEDDIDAIDFDENFKMLKEALTHLDATIEHLNEVRQEEFSPHLNLKPLNLNKFVEHAIYNVSAIARHEHCEIINNIESGLNVMGVEVYMDSIILNFLTNAIKYASKERDSFIELSASQNGTFTILEIKDNGLGIDIETHRNRLFKFKQTFHKHDEARGIGLFITKNHVESIGGKIEVESEVNVGSKFKIYFRKA
jgi:PAS domain S-box-containing protein